MVLVLRAAVPISAISTSSATTRMRIDPRRDRAAEISLAMVGIGEGMRGSLLVIRYSLFTPCASFSIPKKKVSPSDGVGFHPSHGGDHDVRGLFASPVLPDRLGTQSAESAAAAHTRAGATP